MPLSPLSPAFFWSCRSRSSVSLHLTSLGLSDLARRLDDRAVLIILALLEIKRLAILVLLLLDYNSFSQAAILIVEKLILDLEMVETADELFGLLVSPVFDYTLY
jgi:hypothetical protein